MAVTGASLNPIYQRLNGADEYHPFDADTFSDWSMEAGDVVTVSRGSDSYQSPIHSMKVVWKGAPQTTISSTGKKERDTVTKQAKRKYGRGGSGLRSSQGLGHKIEETDEHWQSMYWDGYNGLSSRIEQTASYWQAEFNNMYDGLRGFVEITAEHWEAEFQNTYAGLVGYVEVTAEHWKTAFENAYAGLVGYVEVTAEGWHSEFQNAYTGMIGYVDATADHWMSVLENTESGLRSSIQQQANRIGLVVEGTGDNAHIKAAEIVASINDQTGESQVRLAADKVLISGTTKLNDVFTVTDDYVQALVSIYAAPGAVFNGDHVGSFYYSQQEQGHSVSYGILKKAEVDTSTNTLKIWKFGDSDGSPSITFKKAAAVSGSWSGSTFTAQVADSGAQSVTTSVILQIEGAANPNAEFYAKIYKDNPQDPTNQLESTKITLLENVNSKKVYAHTGSGTSRIDKGAISTVATYNAGWDYGQAQRVRTTAEATSQELTIKTLSYGQRWTIKDTYTASNGTTSDVKYTVAAPTDSNLIDSNIKSGVTIFGVTGSYSASSTVTAEWQQSNPSSSANPYNKYVIKKDGTVQSDLTITVTPSVSISYNSSTHNYTATGAAVAGGALRGTTTVTGGTEAYNAGWDYGQTQRVRSTATATSQETTIKSLGFGERWTITDTYTASNGTTSTVKYTVSAPARPADPTITAVWEQTNPSSSANPYNKYVVKKDGTAISGLTITVTAGASISYNSSTHKYTATGTASAGGSQRGSATSTSGTEAYDAGSTAGYNSAHLTSSWNSAGTRLTVTKTTSGSYNSLSFDVGADVAISYNSTFHTYYATGYALVDSITRASSGDTSGTEAYDAGYNTGYDAGYAAGSGGGITWAGMEIDGSTATSRTITSATDVDLIVRQNGSYITLQSITLTPSGGGSDHPNSVTFTKGSMTTEQAGGHTIYRFTYSLTNTTGNWPYSGRTTFYY